MEKDILHHAQDYAEKMAKGINPITGEKIPENDTLNNVRISRCLFYVSDVLKKEMRKKHDERIPFYLTRNEINKYVYLNYDVTMSKIVENINSLRPTLNMKKLKVVDVNDWLVSIDLLEVVEKNGRKEKLPTDRGRKMGMYVEHRDGFQGKYDVTIYKKEMQTFIIDNFECLLEFLQNK